MPCLSRKCHSHPPPLQFQKKIFLGTAAARPMTPFLNGAACSRSSTYGLAYRGVALGAAPTPSSAENLTSFEHVGDDGGFLGIGAVHELQPLQVVKVIVVGCHPRGVTLRPKLVDER
jgi:hypothetical protein